MASMTQADIQVACKLCARCKSAKLHAEFAVRRASFDGLQRECRSCRAEVSRRYQDRWAAYAKTYRNHTSPKILKDRNRKSKLKTTFGLSLEQYEAMLKAQNGVCALCLGAPKGRWNTFHVDHDHETDQVRGLLCNSCNTALGLFQDDADLMEKSAKYVRKGGLI